ncbi:hypothetical protein E1264_37890 [Actinomadura sp. KC216]|uniref:hypothetical protein n=1 Tax=Actinomadura sp. KC216 TaxID=2530370 RepID=UPI001050AD75|nr:hypothetical protein [Actinomadura sp. KC216]TDB76905.1 hypothetical protein E1264_37890 [Actinomadura sp. KC216]
MSLDAIDAVDWSAIPNPTGHEWDDPEYVAHALRLLTISTTAHQTGDATAHLAGRGFINGHAGTLFPAAYAATPILLELVEHGQRPRIKDAALGLLFDALNFDPFAGHDRVNTPYDTDVPLCCAIARQIRSRQRALLAYGNEGKWLLADAGLHWRLTIEETEPQSDGILSALAVLEGAPFHTPTEAELHTPLFPQPASTVRIDTLTADASGAAFIQLSQTPSVTMSTGSALYPAECGF